MDSNNGVDTSPQYLMCYATHYSRGSGSVFTPSRTFAGFRTQQTVSSRQRKTCRCICTCTPTPWPKDWQRTTFGANILPAVTRKRALGEDSDKENQTEDSASPSKKQKRAYTKRRTIDQREVQGCFDILIRPGGHLLPFCFLFSVTKMQMGRTFPAPIPMPLRSRSF